MACGAACCTACAAAGSWPPSRWSEAVLLMRITLGQATQHQVSASLGWVHTCCCSCSGSMPGATGWASSASTDGSGG